MTFTVRLNLCLVRSTSNRPGNSKNEPHAVTKASVYFTRGSRATPNLDSSRVDLLKLSSKRVTSRLHPLKLCESNRYTRVVQSFRTTIIEAHPQPCRLHSMRRKIEIFSKLTVARLTPEVLGYFPKIPNSQCPTDKCFRVAIASVCYRFTYFKVRMSY